MNKTRSISFFVTLLLLVAGIAACSKQSGSETDEPKIVCAQSGANILLGEKVTVNVVNIDPATEVSVKFGSETTLTRTGAGVVSYAFKKSGTKTITVTMSPEQIGKTQFKLYVEKLCDLQTLAKNLKADPNLCLVMTHRANSSDWSIPENSLPAIEKSIADGVDILENDVYTTKDGVLVVSHDSNISRETNGSGEIKNLTLSQIKSYCLKDRNGKVTSEKMLTLDEYLDACKGRVYINIDIGDRDAKVSDVVSAVGKKGMTGQCLIYCNNADKIRTAFQTNPASNVYTWCSVADELVKYQYEDYLYFSQCGWNPTTAAASRTGKVDSSKQPTSSSSVAKAINAGTIITVNAIYTMNTGQFWPYDFKTEQLKDIFTVYPTCQCIHVDTGKEARAALVAYGKHVTVKE